MGARSFPHRKLLATLFGLALVGVLSGGGCRPNLRGAVSPRYPTRTIAILCPWAPGGGSDRVARFLADQLQRELGVPVVVVNQTGGRGFIGHAAGAHARPDGYTLTLATFELCTFQALGIADLSWRDLEPLAQVNGDPAAILVRRDAPWQTLHELLEAARQQPGKLTMSGTAAGAAWDLARAGLLLAAKLPADAIRWVPSQGAAPALVELLGGHVDSVCCSVAEALSQIAAGQLRVLAVMGPRRLAEMPEVPTLHELGIDWEVVGWRGLMLPRGVPPEVRKLLAARVRKVVASDAYRQFMQQSGFGIVVREGEDFRAFLAAEERKWQAVIQRVGYRLETASAHDPGPWCFPLLLAAGLGAGGLGWATAACVRRRAVLPPDGSPLAGSLAGHGAGGEHRWRRAAGLVGALGLYLAVVPWLGFLPATFVLSAGMMRWLRMRWTPALGVAALLIGVIWVCFVQVFHVALPQGVWTG